MAGTSSSLDLGRYTLHGEIASGGMATVYFGRQRGAVGFSRVVAIKRMHPRFVLDPRFSEMFVDEAMLASRIEHPNVVTTLDVVADAGEIQIVMEYVRGQSLSALAAAARDRGERVPVPIAASVIMGVLSGLHAAHEAKGGTGELLHIVHRDVSPQNILVGVDGIARVTDFGVAKASQKLHVTQDGQLKGKLSYMSPEQFTGGSQAVDRGADIFAAGVVLWELLAGRRLFRGRDLAETMTQVLASEIPPLREVRDDVPAALEAVVEKALQRDRDERWATAREFEQALDDAAGRVASARTVGEWVQRLASEILAEREAAVKRIESAGEGDRASSPPAASPRPAPEARLEPPTQTEPATSIREPPARARRGPGAAVLLLVGVAAVGALAIAFAFGRDEPGPRAAMPELASAPTAAAVPTGAASASTEAQSAPEPPPAAPSEPTSAGSPGARTRPRGSASSRGYYPPRP